MAINLPYPSNRYDLYDKFRQEMPIRQIGQQIINTPPEARQQTRADFQDNAPPRPGYIPPGMNVQYKAPVSDQIATQMLGAGPGGISPADEANNALKGRAIDATIDKNASADAIARAKVGISQQRADVYAFKANNPGIKIIAPKGGDVMAINSATGEVVKNFGSSGTLSDADRIDLEQSGRMEIVNTQQKGKETLAEITARHAKELADAKAAANTGTTRTETVTDATGNKVGTRTTTTRPNAAAPKKGDKKTFPNGVQAEFDGTGWLPVKK